jgi:hypothetical protein
LLADLQPWRQRAHVVGGLFKRRGGLSLTMMLGHDRHEGVQLPGATSASWPATLPTMR